MLDKFRLLGTTGLVLGLAHHRQPGTRRPGTGPGGNRHRYIGEYRAAGPAGLCPAADAGGGLYLGARLLGLWR